jgi:hypothetical protein
MKKNFLILISFLALNSVAQNKVSIDDIMKAKDNVIAYDWYGNPSSVVRKLFDLIKEEKYLEVRKSLSSKNPSEKFVAAICCDKLSKRNKINLTTNEQRLIIEIYNSNEIVYSLIGCTYMEAKTIREYMYSKDDKTVIGRINHSLDELL